jgi:DnaJ family protein A protein 2
MNPYNILEISEDATEDMIRKAYLEKARKTHPDKGGDEEAFKQVTESYEILMKDKDKTSISGMKIFENMFDTFFPINENLNIKKTIELTLEQFYTGYESEFTYKRNIVDPNSDNGVCNECNGNKFTKAIEQINSYLNEQGYEECYKCKGTGVLGNIISVNHTIYLSVPKGCESDKKIVKKGKGNENIKGEKGDFILQLKMIDHKIFTRKDNDLHKDLTINLKESLIGIKYKHKPLYGKTKSIKLREVLNPGIIKRIRNLGMPIKNSEEEYGDLYVHIKVKFPKNITELQSETIKKIF